MALVFPYLAAERLRGTRPHLFAGEAGPAAMVEGRGGQARVAAVDHAAAAAGVAISEAVVAAERRVPGLRRFAHDPRADCDWLERLADACRRWTGRVVAWPPDALLLDLSDAALGAEIAAHLARRGIAARHAVGDTPGIALALARCAGAPAPDARGAVRRLPVAALSPDRDDAAALAAAGVRTIGDLAAIGPAQVAARFGTGLAALLRELDAPRRIAFPPPPAAETAHRATPALLTRAALLAAVAALADEAMAALARRGEVARCWRLRVFARDGGAAALRLDLAEPARGAAALVAAARRAIAALPRPLYEDSGWDLIRLEATRSEPLGAAGLALEGGDAAAPARPAPAGGRRRQPDTGAQRQLALPSPALPCVPLPCLADDAAPIRPIHLFDPPQPIEPLALPDDGAPPARFRWRRGLHEVARVAGPDGAAGGRAYYRIEDRRGRRLWIFHDRAGAGGRGRWFVHGLLA